MKKISLVLLICLSFTFVLSACGQAAAVSSETKTTQKEIVADNKTETPVSFASSPEEAVAAQNADGDEDVSIGAFGYVYYGMYPQTIADKDAVKQMSATTDETGYYYCAYDGQHYAKVSTAAVYGEKYEFTNERKIERRNTYYFKVEPIKWRVYGEVSLTGGLMRIYLVSDVILDSMAFLDSLSYEEAGGLEFYIKNTEIVANNWAYSDLRKWLNGDFYKNSFTTAEKEKIESRDVTEITDVYPQDNATDKVFALSLSQAQSLPADYLLAQTTDYARCRNTFMSVYANWYGNGRYWLSTPGPNTYSVAYVSDYKYVLTSSEDTDKTISTRGESIGAEYMGVRPAITLSVDSLFKILTQEEEEEE